MSAQGNFGKKQVALFVSEPPTGDITQILRVSNSVNYCKPISLVDRSLAMAC